MIIIYYEFFPQSRRGNYVKSDFANTIIANIQGTCAFIFNSCAIFTVYPNNTTWAGGGRCERTQGHSKMAALNSIIYMCTRALHSFLTFAHCLAVSTVIPLLPQTTFTPSIQPNLGLPRNLHLHPPSTLF